MNIKLKWNRVLIAVDAYVRGHKRKKFYNRGKKTILIVFQQIFGDAIVFQNALEEYSQIFSTEKGYKVVLLARPSVASFMCETIPIPKEIEIQKVDFKRFLEEYSYYKEIVKKYSGFADILIVPGTSLSAEIFSAANDAERKIGLVRSIDLIKPITMAVFSKIAYTERVRPNKDEMMLQRHRRLLNYLGADEYKASLPVLKEKDRVIKDVHYVVMCPGSSKMEKCWPTERFAEIADYIIEKYGYGIHLCGGREETQFESIILSLSKHREKIISHIGKTTFSDWSAIVQYADLVIGNDSATMHLAAASRRKAICIAGAYDKYQFFPYKVDYLDENDLLPITLVKNMPCEWCRTIGYDAGYNNDECKKRIINNQCAICIESISVDEVKEQIDLQINL